MARQALSQRIALGIQGIALSVAKFAGYNAAQPSKTQAPATRTGTNPNSSFAQLQRVRLSFEGENAIKNTSFARNYVLKRRMYCSSGITYAPDTGDHALDEAVSAYCIEQWKRMGIGCSMQQAFSRVADVFLPERGDSALQWYRDEDSLRLLEVTADRIGEIYTFTRPTKDLQTGETYFSGLFLRGPNTTAYKIYERGFDMVYTNPQRVNACDVLFFKDDITGGVRGVSIFAAALEDINSRYQILKSTKDTMQQQSKIAAIASNNSGSPSELDYETVTHPDGAIEYQETFADGAVVKYQFNGDSYQVLKGEHPSEAFIGGMKYLDASAALAVGMPYEFLFSGAESGGAPFRGAFEAAGKEIMRIRRDIHTPKLDTIAYVTIMDGVERGKLPPKANIARGSWNFGTLPTADSFRDDAADIKAIRAGITTKSAVITANSGRSFPVVLRESMQEAVATAMAVEDANRTLVKAGYKPSVTVADIAQVSDNPQQAAAAENIQQGKPADGPEKPQGEAPAKPVAAMAEWDESKHHRGQPGNAGEFGPGGGGAKKTDAPKNESATKTDDDDGIDSKISSVRDGKGSIEFFHGTRMKDADLHIGKTFTDNQNTADNYASEKTFSGTVDLSGLKIAKVKKFDREDANYGAVGDSDSDIADLQDRGIDLIEYEDEDPSGRSHDAYRIVSDKALDRFKDGVILNDNRVLKLAQVASEYSGFPDDVEVIKKGLGDLDSAFEYLEKTTDTETANDIFKEAKLTVPKKPDSAALAEWDESKHHRGQPGNAGEFGPGGGGAKKTDAPKNESAAKTGDHKAEEPHRDKADGGSSEGSDPSHVKLTNSRVLDETDKALKVKVNLGEGSMPIWIPKSHASVSDDGTVHVAQWVLDAKHKEFDTGFNPDLHGEQIQTGNPPKPPTAEEIAQREADSKQWMKEAAERNERNQKARSQKAAKKEKELTPEQIASRELEAKKQASIKTSRRNAFAEAQADYFANKELPGKENSEKRKAKKEEFLKDPEFVKRQLDRLDSGQAPRGWEDAVIKK